MALKLDMVWMTVYGISKASGYWELEFVAIAIDSQISGQGSLGGL